MVSAILVTLAVAGILWLTNKAHKKELREQKEWRKQTLPALK